jgi:hypothetical protein
MLNFPIPIAASSEDLVLGARATREGWTPGFLIPPDVLTEVAGEAIVKVANELDPYSNGPTLNQDEMDTILPILDLLGINFNDKSIFKASGIQHRTIEGVTDRAHTDQLYEDLAFWLCGETDSGLPRSIELATTDRFVPSEQRDFRLAMLEAEVPGPLFSGEARVGWGMCFLAVNSMTRLRTLHRVGGTGSWLRYGPHNLAGEDLKRRQLSKG